LLDAEAHRFAISRYRKSHRKNLFSDIYPVQ
jgi:excinuclease UvrABC nuclease subunit